MQALNVKYCQTSFCLPACNCVKVTLKKREIQVTNSWTFEGLWVILQGLSRIVLIFEDFPGLEKLKHSRTFKEQWAAMTKDECNNVWVEVAPSRTNTGNIRSITNWPPSILQDQESEAAIPRHRRGEGATCWACTSRAGRSVSISRMLCGSYARHRSSLRDAHTSEHRRFPFPRSGRSLL